MSIKIEKSINRITSWVIKNNATKKQIIDFSVDWYNNLDDDLQARYTVVEYISLVDAALSNIYARDMQG